MLKRIYFLKRSPSSEHLCQNTSVDTKRRSKKESCWQIISKKKRWWFVECHLTLLEFLFHMLYSVCRSSLVLVTKQPILFFHPQFGHCFEMASIVFLFFSFFLFLFPGSRGTVESRDVSLDDRPNTSMKWEIRALSVRDRCFRFRVDEGNGSTTWRG